MFASSPIVVNSGTLTLVVGSIAVLWTVIKIFDRLYLEPRNISKQNVRCRDQHQAILAATRQQEKHTDRIETAVASLLGAVEKMAITATADFEVQKMRHEQVMRSLDALMEHLKTMPHYESGGK